MKYGSTIILELRKGAKGNFDYGKIEVRPNIKFIRSNHVNRQELVFLDTKIKIKYLRHESSLC